MLNWHFSVYNYLDFMQPHFSKGSSDSYAFVFSCPGRHEEIAMHPAAGKTGRNFESLLALLSLALHETFIRDSVTITNAWSQIEYKSRTGRSEATDLDIQTDSNIERLSNELRHVTKMIVFCGGKAKLALNELVRRKLISHPTKIAFVEHLGARGLLSIKRDIQGRAIVAAKEQRRLGRRDPLKSIQAENTRLRLEVVVRCLLDSTQLLDERSYE